MPGNRFDTAINNSAFRIPSEEFTMNIDAPILLQRFKDFQLTLTGTGTHKDRNYKFQPAAVTLTINAPEPTENKEKEPKLANAQK